MFNELTKLFGGQRKERRHSPRKKVRFAVSWINGKELVPAIGMEISLNGCLLATKSAPSAPEFDVVMELEGRKIRVRLKTARKATIVREGLQWTVVGATFSGIAADDYDALVRFCKDMKAPDNKAARELASMDKTDDAYRMLPLRVQQRVLDALVNMGRLDMPQGTQSPLMRMSSLGDADGKQRLAVHSRVAGGRSTEPRAFDSIIVIDGAGNVRVEA